ncbi:putative HTH-type transcriptional regulator YwnA [Streptomyces ambofaciens ATCC 23877]|uniref:Putative HTH-type transcriptional regulator YwnA n=1 Tax=Streptomyces ambofaciens (strain ATCC 23877 / 3486 / DSM 40053 / JCM 4204 / NBRC 12836 / NRRL B-2516) TaxID=278992 RepID=A0AC58_STRA7|nr:Rrf2 family transcriptional regulator [Streptomyces ambofaciens]AKZ60294.1 putative HTH-type transcriptional regulator YwnA [Streptomyces ambofaciens ATCC 23877]CAJ88062.1 putative transcriptional regulator [Streptomyces ambofaciens ATCC 23877]
MSANSRLTIAAHALAWIGLYQRRGHEVATSEQIATSANTNPVVIRRLLGELRKAGLVESRRGVGAGWSLARELESMTLLDVYEAVEPGPLFAMHRTTPDQECVVGHGIQPAMQNIYEGIEKTLRDELARVTLANVLRDVLAAPRRPPVTP